MTEPHRCAWAESDPLLRAYHDEEWGVPQHDSRALWELLMLEGFQAGLASTQNPYGDGGATGKIIDARTTAA